METKAGDPGAFAQFDLNCVDSPAFITYAATLRAGWLVLAALALGACGAAPPERGEPEIVAIPSEFHGSWSIDPAFCNFEGDTLDNELSVSAEAISFHAETHRVRTVSYADKGLKVSYVDNPDAYREPPANLALSPDGSKLNDLWHRCPAQGQK